MDQSLYVPVWVSEKQDDTSIARFSWLTTWCSYCKRYFMLVEMRERIACPYCRICIEPSTRLFNDGPPPDNFPHTKVELV